MFKRRTKSKTSFLVLHSSNRGSDIAKPENTSLIVNESDSETDELPRQLTSILSESEEEEEVQISIRKSSSLMNSLTQKTQSTPKRQGSSPNRVLKVVNSSKSPNLSRKINSKPSQTASKNKSQSEKKKVSYFEEVIKVCGATPQPGDSSFLLNVDQTHFSMEVNKKLKENKENIQKFIASLEEEIENKEHLQKLLAHTLTDEDCEVARGPVQEPLMRMLLNVDCIQTDVLNLLINKLASVVIDGKSEESHLVSSILRQIRFLNTAKDFNISSKLFEIIHVASTSVQREIIFFLPEIIPEEEAEETCTQLIDLLKFDAKLTHVIVDALTNFPLKADLKNQVRAKVINRLDKSPPEFLPSLVQFALGRCETEELNEIINGLRHNLPFTLQHFQIKTSKKESDKNKNADEDSKIKLAFENLKFSVMASKQMADEWIKIISSVSSYTEFRCVDLVVLIIFYSCLFGRKSQILTLIRNKIRSGILLAGHVKDMFKILKVMAIEYFSTILELASFLLSSFEDKITEFGGLFYTECFTHFNDYMKQTVISEILLHVGTGSPGVINSALNILKELSETQKQSLCQYTVTIMGLLIKIQDLDLNQVRLLTDVIAGLVFCEFADENNSWQDELQIFIRKQLVSSKLDQCKKGITAAVMVAKHAGKKEEDDDFKYTQINELLELAMGSTSTSDIKRSFFNDEFAIMLKESELNTEFLKNWNKKIYREAMDNLFVKDLELENSDFPMYLQYSLIGDNEEKLVFPAVVFIISTYTKKHLNIPVTVIPSSLRLLWCSKQNFNKLLPLFFASVIMPEDIVYESFDSFDDNQQRKILDCLFLCANYLIECINALCVNNYMDKALFRVKQLIKIRKHISTHVHFVPEYTPNHCQFYTPVQKIVIKKKTEKKQKKGRKRKLDEVEAETSHQSIDESQAPRPSTSFSVPPTVQEEQKKEQKPEETNLHIYDGYFRDLNWVTHKLLDAKLNLNPKKFYQKTSDNDDYCSYRPVEKAELHSSDVLFLLEDFIYKSEQILKESRRPFNPKIKTPVLPIKQMKADEFITAAVKILPNIFKKIEKFSAYCEDLLKANDYIHDAKGMYIPEACDVKLAMAAALKIVADIVSWREFQSPCNKPLLRDVLMILTGRTSLEGQQLSLPSIASTAVEAANRIAEFGKTVLVISGAFSIVKIFQACLNYSSTTDSTKLADLCYELLTRKWYTATGADERGSVYNQHLDFLLKTYFSSVNDKLEIIFSTVKFSLEEVQQLTGKDSTMITLKTINKSNFPLLYRTICESLVSASTEEFSKNKNNDQHLLDTWLKIVEILLILVEIAKIHSSRVNLAALLKRSQSIIQLFLSKGIPLVESALKVKSVEVLSLLKSFQTVTRFLHSICCHSKITNDSVVAAHVPIIRSLCEKLTLEVKGILIINQIPKEFITIGILKNRDIKGNDILSQESLDDDSDDDSELPPEETPSDDEDPKNSIKEENQETSEVY